MTLRGAPPMDFTISETIRDLVAKGYDPLAIRYALISTRYRESMNFSLTGLQEAASAVTTLRDLADKLQTTVASIDEAYLELSSASSFEEAADLASQIKQEITTREGLSCSIGVTA